jgi:S-phase kinase-associated protein 1
LYKETVDDLGEEACENDEQTYRIIDPDGKVITISPEVLNKIKLDKQTYRIIDPDGDAITISPEVLNKIKLYKETVDDLGEEACEKGIPSQTNPDSLRKIVEWCTHHRQDPEFPTSIPEQHDFFEEYMNGEFDQAFMLDVDNTELPYLISQTSLLNISSMMTALCREFAQRIKNKTPEQIRNTFELGPPPSEEKQEQLRLEFAFITE